MRRRLAFALGAVAALGLVLSLTTQAGQPGKATYLGSYRWAMDDPAFGGLSSLAMLEGGTRLIAISDSADLFQARVTRDASGRITAITTGEPQRLRAIAGEALAGKASDAEGLALDPQGGLFVSFEAQHRIRHYPAPDQPARRVPGHPDFDGFQINSGLEALAIDARGHLFTLPERSGALDRPFPVYRFDGRDWDIPFRIPRSGPFLPVSADIGPDGWLYILERALTGPGFRSRLRRFDITGDRLNAEETLLQTRTAQHDNLEGLSVWQDGQGRIRLSMVSDDNFKFFQRSEIVEYALDAPLASLPDKE